MKRNIMNVQCHLAKLLTVFAIAVALLSSCKDEYLYDSQEPDWLGSSIYDYLSSNGNYTNYVKLVDDLNYKEILSLTGSKTVFVASDSAFNEFYKSNSWGVTSYDQLTVSQKKYLFKFSMINNAYILSRLANYYSGTALYEGFAMRQVTELNAIDSIPFLQGDDLPQNSYWDSRKSKGLYLLRDNTDFPIAFFTQAFLDKYSFTDEDLSMLLGLESHVKNDVYIFNNKVIQKDIVCKNGYIHVLSSVLVPPTNMAQYVEDNNGSDPSLSTKIFAKLLDHFCAPFYDAGSTSNYNQLHPEFTDSIFVKHYFASNGGSTLLPDNKTSAPNLLVFDPGWNSYKSTNLEADMAAMFVPTDDAMKNFLHSGIGAVLGEKFNYDWDSIPDKIILPFLKRHMRTSLIESVPSKFTKMVDDENYALPVEKNHIVKTYTGVNGEVYVTNEVYPPVDYISVYSPVLYSDNSKIMNWAIDISETSVDGTEFAFYRLYLNSLVSNYSLMIPTDEYFDSYLDPIAYAQNVPAVLKFWYDKSKSVVNATIYSYDKTTRATGDSIGLISGSSYKSFIKNRLWQLLDSHIVVGDIESGNEYYITKANDIIKIEGSGTNMKIQGGQDIAENTVAAVSKVFRQENGNTYFLKKPIQPSLRSVYKILSETPEFSKFFELLSGVPDTCVSQIFAQQGIDYRIKFFNAYQYTVYVPTNDAINAAITAGKIKDWQTIYNMTNEAARSTAINKMIRFLKYHFQDNAVFVGQTYNAEYQSATIKNDNSDTYWGTAKNKYLKIGVVGDGSTLKLTADGPSGSTPASAEVDKSNGLYNIIAKDYIFAKLPTAYKNVDGTGNVSGTAFSSSTITTSASAVIHQINNVLTFD
ncbi:MAG: fasciclin domain-containing protein [Paludibacter sp.]|nr:fasciclin domain-containing protein [Paludibacter sp.]